ncbi:hypothetical protein [Bradyrhizobium sp. STM 3557]|uniref:hypothetical protein n=1 Tax=Bradyrhizobium sp. STM 3557 TaxID=578920 RepID=UPI003890F558
MTLLALRFDALTIPRPGMVNEMEWSEVDWDAERWTIPATKMKTGWDRVVQDFVDKNETAKSTGLRGRQPVAPQPGTSRTTARSAAVLVGILALIGIGYGIYKAVSLGRDEIVVRYTACLREYERNCGFNHDVYLYCYADAAAYIKEKTSA